MIAVNQAFYESSLGTVERDPTTAKPVGVFQYKADTWSEHHNNLNRHNEGDQIVAIFNDIQNSESEYQVKQATGSIPKDLLFSEYFSVMHHSGPNYPQKHKLGAESSKWKSDSRVMDYNRKTSALDFE